MPEKLKHVLLSLFALAFGHHPVADRAPWNGVGL